MEDVSRVSVNLYLWGFIYEVSVWSVDICCVRVRVYLYVNVYVSVGVYTGG